MRKKKKQRRYRLFYLLLLLLVTTLSLSISSYAWFTTNRLVKIDLLNVSVKAQGGLEISVDATNWKSSLSLEDIQKAIETYPGSTNQLPNVLEAISTVGEIENGRLKMYHGTAVNNIFGSYILETTKVEESNNNPEGKYITFDLFLKTNTNTKLYLTPESNVTYTSETTVGIENTTRFAFIEEGTAPAGTNPTTIQNLTTNSRDKVHIWEPNYDTHTEAGIQNAKDTYNMTITNPSEPLSYDGVASEISKSAGVSITNATESKYPNYFQKVQIDYYTPNNFTTNQEIFSLTNGITKIKVYMWVEGQDIDCENNAATGNMSLNISLSTNPS